MRPAPSHLAFLALVIAGCASGSMVNQQRDPVLLMIDNGTSLQYSQDVRVISTKLQGSPTSLWPRLNAAYASLGLPVTERDTADYALAAQNAQFSGRFANEPASRVVDCGLTPFGSQRANSYHVWLTVASQLQPSGTGTNLRTTVTAKAQDQNSSTDAVQCGSTGALEADIAKQLGPE
ncbi:MAG TPA: hypothetical protein VII66_05550 [Gemmatimonadaceae bacterium]